MEYVTDSQGQIKVMDDKGNTKFLPKLLVDNVQLMRRNKFTAVVKPDTLMFEEDNTTVAESSETKKRGRKL